MNFQQFFKGRQISTITIAHFLEVGNFPELKFSYFLGVGNFPELGSRQFSKVGKKHGHRLKPLGQFWPILGQSRPVWLGLKPLGPF